MPVFWFLLLLGLCFLWVLMAFAFKPIGKFFHRLWKDVKDAMKDE